MKILHVTHSFPTISRPWTTPFVYYLTDALKQKSDITVYLALPQSEDSFLGQDQSYYTFYPGAGNRISHKGIGKDHRRIGFFEKVWFLLAGVRRVRRIVKEKEIGLIHAHWSLPSGLIAYLASRLTGTPYVITTHGRDVLNYPQYGYDVPASPVMKQALRIVLRNAASVLTTGPTTEEAVRALEHRAAIATIPVGFDCVKDNKPNKSGEGILFIGDLIPRKGVDLLIKAIGNSEYLQKKHAFIVGDGDTKQELIELCVSLKLDNVDFLGFCSPEKIQELFTKSSILVFPSRVEAFGIVLLEALYAGLQIVGSRTGALPLLYSDPVLRSQITPVATDSLEELQHALEKRVRFSAEPVIVEVRRHLIEAYSWSSIAEKHLAVYRRHIYTEKS